MARATSAATSAVRSGWLDRLERFLDELVRRAPDPHRRLVAAAAAVATAGWLVMGEVDRLLTGLPDATGRTASAAGLLGPTALLEREDSWEIWRARHDDVSELLGVHASADVLFFVPFALLLLWALRPSALAGRLVVLYLAVEVLELAALAAAAVALDGDELSAWLSVPVAALATAKWVALLLAVLLAAGNPQVRDGWGAAVRRLGRALYFQRLSLLVVGMLAVLCLLPLPDIWDQLPDVQRGWTDGWRGAGHALAAGVAVVVMTAGLVLLGRQRSERAREVYDYDEPYTARTEVHPLWWLAPSGVALAASFALRAGGDLVDDEVLGWFVALPVALVGLSLLLDAIRADEPDRPLQRDPQRVLDIRRAGDVLALLLPVVGLLALVRSYTAPVTVAWVDDGAGRDAAWAIRLAVLVLAVPLALLVLWFGRNAIARATRWSRGPAGVMGRLLQPQTTQAFQRPWAARWMPFVFWLCSVAALVWLLLAPMWFGENLGVVATMLFGLGSWVLFLGFVQVRLQKRRPLRIFRALGLRATPLVVLLLAVPLVASLGDSDRDLHAVRHLPGEVRPEPFERLVAAWASSSRSCARSVPGVARDVQPMVLVAASGGGIRAAYWTASALDQLARDGDCATDAVALSSGVSGGSVGLALSRDGSGLPAAERLADPDTLSTAIAGLLVGDVVGGVTGLRVPAYADGQEEWLDRAGLMEAVWQSKASALGQPFDRIGEGPAGALLLNSADAGSGCRVLVSQVALSDDDAEAGELPDRPTATGDDPQIAAARCTSVSELPAVSLDLDDLYPSGCRVPQLRLASAAMLSARFPTVTPGGRMPRTGRGCAPSTDVQLIDGGYAESSGIGTLADLAPRLAQEIREHNSKGGTLIVPLVVYLEDAARADLAPVAPKLAPEPLVPLAGVKAARVQTTSGAWLQRVSAALVDVCPAGEQEADCRAAVTAVRTSVPGGVVLVAPATRAGVDAPLGWTLSEASRDRLRRAIAHQASEKCKGVSGYACLHTLLQVVDRTAPWPRPAG